MFIVILPVTDGFLQCFDAVGLYIWKSIVPVENCCSNFRVSALETRSNTWSCYRKV